jgi:hypothetical protein
MARRDDGNNDLLQGTFGFMIASFFIAFTFNYSDPSPK